MPSVRPFKEALIDAILEEYAEIPCSTKNTNQQDVQHETAQIKNHGERNASYPATEFDRISLWLDREEKYVYLHPTHGAKQYIFFNQAEKDMCLQALIQRGYTLLD